MLEPVKDSRQPDLTWQIVRSLIGYIRSQGLQKSDQLPSQAELAQQMNVSLASLREALARLEVTGLLYQKHGVGTFLTEDPRTIRTRVMLNLSLTEMIREQGMEAGTSEVVVGRDPPPAEIATVLHVPHEKPLTCIRRVRTADGHPFVYEIAYLVDELAYLGEDPQAYTGSLYHYLESCCNEFIAEAQAVIEARPADASIAQKLQVEANSPLLLLRQTHYNTKGKALIASLDYFSYPGLQFSVTRYRLYDRYFGDE